MSRSFLCFYLSFVPIVFCAGTDEFVEDASEQSKSIGGAWTRMRDNAERKIDSGEFRPEEMTLDERKRTTVETVKETYMRTILQSLSDRARAQAERYGVASVEYGKAISLLEKILFEEEETVERLAALGRILHREKKLASEMDDMKRRMEERGALQNHEKNRLRQLADRQDELRREVEKIPEASFVTERLEALSKQLREQNFLTAAHQQDELMATLEAAITNPLQKEEEAYSGSIQEKVAEKLASLERRLEQVKSLKRETDEPQKQLQQWKRWDKNPVSSYRPLSDRLRNTAEKTADAAKDLPDVETFLKEVNASKQVRKDVAELSVAQEARRLAEAAVRSASRAETEGEKAAVEAQRAQVEELEAQAQQEQVQAAEKAAEALMKAAEAKELAVKKNEQTESLSALSERKAAREGRDLPVAPNRVKTDSLTPQQMAHEAKWRMEQAAREMVHAEARAKQAVSSQERNQESVRRELSKAQEDVRRREERLAAELAAPVENYSQLYWQRRQVEDGKRRVRELEQAMAHQEEVKQQAKTVQKETGQTAQKMKQAAAQHRANERDVQERMKRGDESGAKTLAKQMVAQAEAALSQAQETRERAERLGENPQWDLYQNRGRSERNLRMAEELAAQAQALAKAAEESLAKEKDGKDRSRQSQFEAKKRQMQEALRCATDRGRVSEEQMKESRAREKQSVAQMRDRKQSEDPRKREEFRRAEEEWMRKSWDAYHASERAANEAFSAANEALNKANEMREIAQRNWRDLPKKSALAQRDAQDAKRSGHGDQNVDETAREAERLAQEALALEALAQEKMARAKAMQEEMKRQREQGRDEKEDLRSGGSVGEQVAKAEQNADAADRMNEQTLAEANQISGGAAGNAARAHAAQSGKEAEKARALAQAAKQLAERISDDQQSYHEPDSEETAASAENQLAVGAEALRKEDRDEALEAVNEARADLDQLQGEMEDRMAQLALAAMKAGEPESTEATARQAAAAKASKAAMIAGAMRTKSEGGGEFRGGAQRGARVKRSQERVGWEAQLPPDQRATLQSCRGAYVDPRFSEEVRRYFKQLSEEGTK